MSDQFIPHAPRNLPLPEGGRKSYIPSSIRGIELKTAPIPGAPKGVEIPPPDPNHRGGAEAPRTLEETIVPFGPHKGRMLIQLLNDHPGYLLHLRDDAFTDHEEFEVQVEQFCLKYQHRLSRATGGSSTSILWAASLTAVRREAGIARINTAVLIFEAIDFTAATAAAEQKARERWPGGEYSVAVENIPLADLRRALKAEQPQKGVGHR